MATIKVGINGLAASAAMPRRPSRTSATSKSWASTTCWSPTTWPTCCSTTRCTAASRAKIGREGNPGRQRQEDPPDPERDPANLKWNEVGADIVIESTGLFLDKETTARSTSTPAPKGRAVGPPDDTPMFVFGVNHATYAGQAIISNASAPPTAWPRGQGAERQVGHQARPDDHRARRHRHAEDRGRPFQQGLARRPRHSGKHHSLQHRRRQGRGRGDPALNKKLTGMSFRAPTSDVSVVDLTVELEKNPPPTKKSGRDEGPVRRRAEGVLGYTEDKVVATDFRGDTRSIFDADAGIALDGTFVKVVSWYDNEWGYSNKCLEMVRVVAK